MTIGERIKELRERKRVTQTELAEAVGTTKQNIYKYETGIITNIPSDRIEAIATFFNTSPAYLMGWEKPHYGFRINEARLTHEMDIKTLSDRTNIPESKLKEYEDDESEPTWDELSAIANAFGYSTEDFFWRDFRSTVEQMDHLSYSQHASLAYLFDQNEQNDYVLKKLLIYLRGRSNSEIADSVGVTKEEVVAWKSGESTTFMNYLWELADYIGVDVSEFLTDGLRSDGKSREEIINENLKKYLFDDKNVNDEVLEDVKRYAKIALQMWKDKNNL